MLDRLRRLLPGGHGPRDEPPPLDDITLRPIGVVRNAIKAPQTGGWDEVESRIVLRPELAEALLGLIGYSHVVVLFWPHLVPEEVRGSKPQLHPMDDPANPLQGVLATRAQIRFNPILVTPARLLKVDRNVLRVRGLDAVDGSPVLDLKPYVPRYDSVPEATVPAWVSRHAHHR